MSYEIWAHYASNSKEELKATFYSLAEAHAWIRAQEILNGPTVMYEIRCDI